MRTHLDLFSGIGGFALSARWAGVETIGFAEIDNYAGTSQYNRNSLPLNAIAGGSLNPTWVEWLMG